MTVFRVSTDSAFMSAVKSAKGGDSILLDGSFKKLSVSTSFASKVTIASANGGRPAVVNELVTKGAGNVEFKNIKFEYTSGAGPVFIQNSSNITFNDVVVEGKIVGGLGAGIGVRVRDSKNFTIINSDILNLKNGFNFSNITGVDIKNNNFRGMSNDGMIVGGLIGAEISGNDFRNFKSNPNTKHKDGIQFNTSDSIAPSRNVLIKDNVIVNPEQSHGIFFGNGLAHKKATAYYQDITIADNYLNTAQKLGITIEHGWKIKIQNNTVVQNTDMYKGGDQINIPVINVSSSSMHVTITGNTVPSVPNAANGTWTVSGNKTGSKKLLHWDSPIKSSPSLSAEALKTTETTKSTEAESSSTSKVVASVTKTGGNDEEFRFNGKIAASNARINVTDVDIDDGDTIVFRNFEKGSFAGKAGGNKLIVYDNGAAVKIDSALDLQELVAMSDDVSAKTSGDTLILRIEQDKGFVEFAFDGLADEFRAANHPELF